MPGIVINDNPKDFKQAISNHITNARKWYSKFRTSPVFYSNAEIAIDRIKQDKATPEQWKAMLLNNGAKPEEIQWLGLEQFFEQNPKATKAELKQYIRENQVRIEIVTKTDNTKYGKYSLPGDGDYVEILIKLPESLDQSFDNLKKLGEKYNIS